MNKNRGEGGEEREREGGRGGERREKTRDSPGESGLTGTTTRVRQECSWQGIRVRRWPCVVEMMDQQEPHTHTTTTHHVETHTSGCLL